MKYVNARFQFEAQWSKMNATQKVAFKKSIVLLNPKVFQSGDTKCLALLFTEACKQEIEKAKAKALALMAEWRGCQITQLFMNPLSPLEQWVYDTPLSELQQYLSEWMWA